MIATAHARQPLVRRRAGLAQLSTPAARPVSSCSSAPIPGAVRGRSGSKNVADVRAHRDARPGWWRRAGTRGIITRDLVTGVDLGRHAALRRGAARDRRLWQRPSISPTNAQPPKGHRDYARATSPRRAVRQSLFHADPISILHSRSPGEYQSKLTPMSNSLRNDGRIWGTQEEGRQPKAGHHRPEGERDYYLEDKYPSFGNLVPRDVASRNAKAVCDQGRGVGPGGLGFDLDFVLFDPAPRPQRRSRSATATCSRSVAPDGAERAGCRRHEGRGLNHCVTSAPDGRDGSPTRSALSMPMPVSERSVPLLTVNGRPVLAVRIPLICQSRRIAATMPSPFHGREVVDRGDVDAVTHVEVGRAAVQPGVVAVARPVGVAFDGRRPVVDGLGPHVVREQRQAFRGAAGRVQLQRVIVGRLIRRRDLDVAQAG